MADQLRQCQLDWSLVLQLSQIEINNLHQASERLVLQKTPLNSNNSGGVFSSYSFIYLFAGVFEIFTDMWSSTKVKRHN